MSILRFFWLRQCVALLTGDMSSIPIPLQEDENEDNEIENTNWKKTYARRKINFGSYKVGSFVLVQHDNRTCLFKIMSLWEEKRPVGVAREDFVHKRLKIEAEVWDLIGRGEYITTRVSEQDNQRKCTLCRASANNPEWKIYGKTDECVSDYIIEAGIVRVGVYRHQEDQLKVLDIALRDRA